MTINLQFASTRTSVQITKNTLLGWMEYKLDSYWFFMSHVSFIEIVIRKKIRLRSSDLCRHEEPMCNRENPKIPNCLVLQSAVRPFPVWNFELVRIIMQIAKWKFKFDIWEWRMKIFNNNILILYSIPLKK